MSEIKMSLIENAFDFLDYAIEQLANPRPTPRNLKYAVLHLSSAVELLLKQRLLDEHWSLIFAKVEQATLKKLEDGDFRSVNFDEAIKRLENVCGIVFEKHSEVITKLKTLRNIIEHYHVSIARLETISLLGKTWSFIFDFVEDNIEISLEHSALYEEIQEKMIEHETFIKERLNEIQSTIDEFAKEQLIFECPTCLQESLPLTHDNLKCLFCYYEFTSEEFQESWLDRFGGKYVQHDDLHEYNVLVYNCLECYEQSMVLFHQLPKTSLTLDSLSYICLRCGTYWDAHDISTCMECDALYLKKDNEMFICLDCFNRKVRED